MAEEFIISGWAMTNVKKALSAFGRIAGFILHVLSNFRQNQGLLLSGAIAYYTLLSIVPVLILILIVLSHVMDQEQLLGTVSSFLEMSIPGYAPVLTEQVRVFLQYRGVIGTVGIAVLLFFSSIAFTVLEKAMSVIFHRRIQRRHFLISSIIPYMFMFLIALGILVLSFVAGVLETFESSPLTFFGWELSRGSVTGVAVYLFRLAAEVFLLTALYLIMPIGPTSFRHAFLGGLAATILWELTRRVIIWYYRTFTFVNLIYGSFASAVVFLLSIEAVALIILLGAQVIAEREHGNGKVK